MKIENGRSNYEAINSVINVSMEKNLEKYKKNFVKFLKKFRSF